MGGATAGLKGCDEARQRRIAAKRTISDGPIDARQFLHDHAAGTQIHMADFGIAHLPRWQPDIALARLERGMG